LAALHQDLLRFGNAGGSRVQEYVDSNYEPQFGDLGTNNLPQPSYDKIRLYTGRVNYELSFATATSITSYNEYRGNDDQDLTQLFSGVIPFLAFVGVNIPATSRTVLGSGHLTNKWTEEFRLTSKNDQNLEWLTGFFYTHEKSDNPQVLDAVGSGSPINIFTGRRISKYKEYAGFADLTYHFTPKFDIQVGARYAHNSQTFTTVASGPLEVLTTGQTTPVITSGPSSEGAWTWLVTPRYRFSRDLMAYVRVATGYRPGGPNLPQAGVPDSFRSDKTTNYEVGIKGELMDRKVRFDANSFWIDWSNIQLLNINSATQFAYTSNGSAARSRGFEASVDFKPWQGLTLGANGAFIDATLTKDLPQSATVSPVNGAAGDRLPYSPRWTGNLSADQEFNLGARSTFYVGGNLSFVGERRADFTNSEANPRVLLSSYRQLDLSAGLRRDGYGLNFFVKNANNSRGAFRGTYQTNYIPANGYVLSLINPRTIGFNLTGSF
jgi:outer membrane receptor protein involved in Fe transport